ncbi:MAG: hypothetical protein A2360_00720 [Candidatus Staskawiczbacteria bacterium RIFOXYB1_FULL_32_11]|nr:MAG: hypothetical protein A2360_00720 [Candidatus Staskawiczbacteria bacterium RIFOXYB1_FULL_32_11]
MKMQNLKIINIKILLTILLFVFFMLPLQTFATAYSVSGTQSPDVTTINTGEPIGTYNGRSIWSWLDPGNTTRYLSWVMIDTDDDAILDYGPGWCIGYDLPSDEWGCSGNFFTTSPTPVGLYIAIIGSSGTVTIAEYVPPNTTPSAPTLVSPANASYTSDTTPTLSANYSDSDTSDVGTTNYRMSSGTAQNCLDNTNIVASGTSSATSTNNENTTYTPGSSIGSSGTYYWCAQNDDGVAQSAWTSMGSFILDITVPDIVAIDAGASSGDRTSLTSNTYFKYTDTGSDDQLSFSWTDPSSVSDDTFYYELNADSSSTITGDELLTTVTPYIDEITITEGTSYFHVRPKNGATTWGTERTFIINYDKTNPTISNTSNSLGYLSNTQTATITWATDEASSTQVEYGLTNSYGSITTETDTTTRVTSHTVDVAFTPCQLYYVRVISKDQAQNQATGDNFTIQTQCASGGNAGQVFSIQPITPSQTNQNSNNNQEISQQDPRITLMQKIIELLKEMIRILIARRELT